MLQTAVDKAYWDAVNHRVRGGHNHPFFHSPAQDILWGITDRFFKDFFGKSILEVGCAPGNKLCAFAERYHALPFGVEYTEHGVHTTRSSLERHGFAPHTIFLMDVFNPEFQERYAGAFDAVISFGFIEHFDDPSVAVLAHMALIKPGGLLLIMIPNLRGIYGPLLRFFAPRILRAHNIQCMEYGAFTSLFSPEQCTPLYVGYYGIFNMGLLQAEGLFRSFLLRVLWRAQQIVNPFIRFFYSPKFENRMTSPYLVYIGQKL